MKMKAVFGLTSMFALSLASPMPAAAQVPTNFQECYDSCLIDRPTSFDFCASECYRMFENGGEGGGGGGGTGGSLPPSPPPPTIPCFGETHIGGECSPY